MLNPSKLTVAIRSSIKQQASIKDFRELMSIKNQILFYCLSWHELSSLLMYLLAFIQPSNCVFFASTASHPSRFSLIFHFITNKTAYFCFFHSSFLYILFYSMACIAYTRMNDDYCLTYKLNWKKKRSSGC